MHPSLRVIFLIPKLIMINNRKILPSSNSTKLTITKFKIIALRFVLTIDTGGFIVLRIFLW